MRIKKLDVDENQTREYTLSSRIFTRIKGHMTLRVICHSKVVSPRRVSCSPEERIRSNLFSQSSPEHSGQPFCGSDLSMPAEAKARISREGRTITRRGPPGGNSPPELWFPYAPITEPSTIMFVLVYFNPAHAPLSASRPSQTISVGHFWPLMDVDLLMGLSHGEATFAVRWTAVCVRRIRWPGRDLMDNIVMQSPE